jgi:hypothetical protein
MKSAVNSYSFTAIDSDNGSEFGNEINHVQLQFEEMDSKIARISSKIGSEIGSVQL